MKINSDQFHLFILGNKFEHLWAKVDIIEYEVNRIVCTHKGEGEGSSQKYTIGYKEEGGFQGCVRALKKKKTGPKKLKTFLFLYKRNYYIAIHYCIKKSINRHHRNLFDIGLVKFNLRDK